MTRRRLSVALVVLVLLGASWADAAAQTTTGAAESEFARKTKCFAVGRLLYKDLTESYDEGLGLPLNPMYTYSKELNTCVAYVGWRNFRKGEESRLEFLIDVLSNITILQSAKVGADALSPSDSDEFKRQLRAFFPDAP